MGTDPEESRAIGDAGGALDPPRFEAFQAAIDVQLAEILSASPIEPDHLSDAIHHALLSPGKRIRPLLLLLIATRDAKPKGPALEVGAAVEMVHTASLVLDDLPSMDDAATRRQRPTAHVVFGEANAILVAIALLNKAFGLLAELDVDDRIRTELAALLSNAVGWNGLVAGQAHDIAGDSQGRADAEHINWLKTGALFVAAAEMGAVLGGYSRESRDRITSFANRLGQAFQTADDLIDVSGDPETAGKDLGKDRGKNNIVSIIGAKRARDACHEHLRLAIADIREVDMDPDPILALIERHFGSLMPTDR